MSLVTPTTEQVSDNIIAGLEATLNQTIPLLPKSFLRVLSTTLAAVFIVLWKYGGFIFLQQFVQFASNESTVVNGKTVVPLQLWGELIGVGLPIPATQADLNLNVEVTQQTGSLPLGTQFVGTTNGVTYLSLQTVNLNAANVIVPVRAQADQSGGDGSGTIGNLLVGDSVGFANPTPNVNRTATVDEVVAEGIDEESTEDYRQRIIDRFQKTPQGGAYADYEQWAESTADCNNAYPYSGDPGIVDVYAESASGTDGILPSDLDSSEIGGPDGFYKAVLDNIELDEDGLATRRPVNAFVNVLKIQRTAFWVNVDGITGIDVGVLPEVQANIQTAVSSYLLDKEPFILGLSILPRNDILSVNDISALVQQIVSLAGGTFTAVQFNVESTTNGKIPGPTVPVPVAPFTGITDYTLLNGEKSKIGQLYFDQVAYP